MMLSKESIVALSDLIENKLSMMHIGNRDDLRERRALELALAELQGNEDIRGALIKFAQIPQRGRHRKVSTLMGEPIEQTEQA